MHNKIDGMNQILMQDKKVKTDRNSTIAKINQQFHNTHSQLSDECKPHTYKKTTISLQQKLRAMYINNDTLEVSTYCKNKKNESFITISSLDTDKPTIDVKKTNLYFWNKRKKPTFVIDFHQKDPHPIDNRIVSYKKKHYYYFLADFGFCHHKNYYLSVIKPNTRYFYRQKPVGKFNTAGTEFALVKSHHDYITGWHHSIDQFGMENPYHFFRDLSTKHYSTDLCYSPNDLLIALASGKFLQLINLENKTVTDIPLGDTIKKIAFVTNNMLVMASMHSLSLYDLQEHKTTHLFDLDMLCTNIRVSPNSQLIAVHLKSIRPKKIPEKLKEKKDSLLKFVQLKKKTFKEMIQVISLQQQKSPLYKLLQSEKWCDITVVQD